MSNAYFANVLDRIRDGVERFWIFHFCAVFFALLVVQRNHGIVDASTARQMSHGICWGALAGLFVQLAGEWRRWRLRKTYAFIVTLIAGAAGWWFWHAVGKDSPRYVLWSMLYWGTTVSLVAASIAVLYRYADGRTLVSRLALNVFCATSCATVLVTGLLICVAAFSALIAPLSPQISVDLACMTYIMTMSAVFLSFLPGRERHDDDGASGKAIAFLFWLLLPTFLLLLWILYMYLGKIAITCSMPSGKLNWFGSVAIAAYVFFWLSLRDSKRRFFALFVRWGWLLLLPVLAAQVAGIVIRYQAYGLTAPRFAGMVTLMFGVVALAMAATKRNPQWLFVSIAASGLLFTVTPLNIIDVPVWNQEMRLKAALKRNGLLQDGSLNLKPGINLSDNDAKTILSAWQYLVCGKNWNKWNRGLEHGDIKPTVWYRPEFTEELCKKTAEICRERKMWDKSLPEFLGIDERKFASGESVSKYASITFSLDKDVSLPVIGCENIKLFGECDLRCRLDDGKWKLNVPSCNGEFDVTEYVECIFKAAKCDCVIPDEDKTFVLDSANAVWRLRPGMYLLTGKMIIWSQKKGSKIDKIHLLHCAIATKKEVE